MNQCIRLQVQDQFTQLFPGYTGHSAGWKREEFYGWSHQLLHDAGSHKAAGTGYQDSFHDRTSLSNIC